MSLQEMQAEVTDLRATLERFGELVRIRLATLRSHQVARRPPRRLRVLRPDEMERVGPNLCRGCRKPIASGATHGRICRYEATRRKHVRERAA